MSETLTTIIAIAVAAILLFVFPLMTMADRVDDQTQAAVQTAVTNFVNNASLKGEITKADYDKLVQTISSTGNTYSVEMTAQINDKNLGKKSVLEQSFKIGSTDYYVEFSNQLFEKIQNDGVVKFKEGDSITVKVSSECRTYSDQLGSAFLGDTGSKAPTIVAQDSTMITATGK